MWKIIVAFVLFAAAALYMLSKGGDVSMGGETHSGDFHAPSASDPAHGAAPAASAAVEAASAAVEAASAAASAASN